MLNLLHLKIFEDWVNRIGAGIISQSKEICPADHKIYSLRNETGTIPSLPLICCSILSAEGGKRNFVFQRVSQFRFESLNESTKPTVS